MSKASPHFLKLHQELIFPVVEEKARALSENSLQAKPLLNFGVGDVAFPIRGAIKKALLEAVEDVCTTRRGYGPSTGHPFLKKAIVDVEYGKYGIKAQEVFISDGIMSDITSLLELFHKDSKIALPNPTYPVYLDSCVLSGRTSFPKKGLYPEITQLPCTLETGFVPKPPRKKCDIVFLCTPNNPTGCSLTKDDLSKWVAYAKKHNSVLIVDAAYEAFIHGKDTPKSIYEIPGAKDVAIELRSFSKTSGFSGLRLSYSIIPDSLMVKLDKEETPLNKIWKQRQAVTFNGPSYLIQKAGAAALSRKALEESKQDIDLYRKCGQILKDAIIAQGFECFGGENSPYLWWKCPEPLTSWEFFDYLLQKHHMISIPGSGFGSLGEGYVRLSSFTTEEDTKKALSRIKEMKF